MDECNMVQQPANPCSTAAESATVTTTTEAANPGSGNLTATTAAATPCPEKCEHTQNTGECSAGDQICFNTLLSSANKIPKYSHLRDFNDNLNDNLINYNTTVSQSRSNYIESLTRCYC